jgi:hypothetical protein
MIDTANGILGGNLSALANGYNASGRTTAQDGFTFSIISGTTDGTTAVTDYSTCRKGSGAATSAYSSTPPGPADPSDAPAGGSPAFFTDGIVMKKHLLASAAACRGVAGAGAGCRRYLIIYEQRQQHAEQNDQEQHRQRSTDQYPSRTALFPAGRRQVIPMDKPDEVLLTPPACCYPPRPAM